MGDKKEKKTPAKEKTQKVEFAIESPEAQQVFLAGDFNQWNMESHPLKMSKKGTWKIKIPLLTGNMEYRFIVDGRWADDPCCAERVNNGLDSWNCVKVVA